ncbi:ATP-grasp fold amidoligase family protein [Lysobacter korlensis]|uniref:ATP-grasp fold amidoligase family protein n=1 Tax=Lysobacter korlensis TaxID=553636 RepID=A0ABV6RQ91_9GAMM
MPLPRPVHLVYVRAQFVMRKLIGVPIVEKTRYLLKHGRWPRLHAPRTLTEKIFARKLVHGHDPRFPVIADKVAVRDWVAQRIGEQYLVPALGVYDYQELDNLVIQPGQVIKCANRSGGVYFPSEAHIRDREAFIRRIRRDLDFDFARWTGEPWYGLIPKRVLVEKSLVDDQGNVPADYKFFVYDGKVRTIQMHIDRFGNHKRAMFDRNWQLIPLGNAIPEHIPPPPKRLAEMIEISETLGREFDFIRVDLFEIDGEQIYFGELTLAPGSGLTTFDPVDYDEIFGRYWQVDPTPREVAAEEERRLQVRA